MDTDGFYEYEKIGAEDTIRLILLQPSVDLEASIQCSLIRVTLEQCDKDVVEHYVALSYVWGDATLRRQISVDGATLDITASLDCALRHLRDQSRLLRVWADGICINQNDFEDRNHQVRMMSSIYLLARHTIIFLGPASPQSEVVMELLKAQDHRLDRPRRSSRNAQTALDQQLRSLVENHLLANAWFTRTWVLQELVLSADPWVQLGSARVRWDTLYHYAVVAEPSSRELRNARHMYEMGMARSRYMATKDKGNEESLQQNDKQLLKLLKARRGLGVSDGRDMIYAHLSLTDSATQEAMAIRYDLSVADVYESFARSTISSAHNFSILFDIEDVDDLDERLEDLPSWVPDWTKPPPVPQRHPEEIYRIKETSLTWEEANWENSFMLSLPKVLCITGKKGGTIKKVFPSTFWTLRYDLDSTESAKGEALKRWIKECVEVEEVIRKIGDGFLSKFRLDYMRTGWTSTEESFETQAGVTVDEELLSLFWDPVHPARDWLRRRGLIAATWAFIVHLDDIRDYSSRGGQIALLEEAVLVKVPTPARAGDILVSFVGDTNHLKREIGYDPRYSDLFSEKGYIFFLRPLKGRMDLKIQDNTRRALENELELKSFPFPKTVTVRHCRYVGCNWDIWGWATLERDMTDMPSLFKELQIFALH